QRRHRKAAARDRRAARLRHRGTQPRALRAGQAQALKSAVVPIGCASAHRCGHSARRAVRRSGLSAMRGGLYRSPASGLLRIRDTCGGLALSRAGLPCGTPPPLLRSPSAVMAMDGFDSDLELWRQRTLEFERSLNGCVIGLQRAIRLLVVAILARGHVLLEG